MSLKGKNTLSKATAEKLGRILNGPGTKFQRDVDPVSVTQSHVTFAQCGALVDADKNLYDAKVRNFLTSSWEWTEFAPVWLWADGHALDEDETYVAIRAGKYTTGGGSMGSSGGETRPVYVCQVAGSSMPAGDAVVIRITNYFCRDSAEQTTCDGDPSPLCYYPGYIQTLTCAGPTDGTAVWWVSWYDYGDVVNTFPAPNTVVVIDGTAAVDAIPAGFDYAPDDGEHPNAGESRPVYWSTNFARGRFIQCVDGEPVLTLGGS